MPKIKKIKREHLSELGDEFTILTDAEIAESGITVETDEVLVIEAPAPQQTSSGETNAELKSLRERLHTVNQESAARRVELKQLRDEVNTLKTTNTQLTTSLAERKVVEAQTKAKSLFTKYVTDKKLEFVSAEAGEDIQEQAFKDLDWTKPVTEEMISAAVDPLLKKKAYVLKTVTLPPTDGGRRSSSDSADVVMDDDELGKLAQEFNIPMAKKE